MNKINVCLINDSFPPMIDGVANAVTNYADIITNEFGKAIVVTPFYPNADDTHYNYRVVRYPSIDTVKMVGYRTGIPFSVEAMRAIEASDIDIIHSHCPVTSTLLARAVREKINKPLVLTYHTKFDIDIANAVHGKLLQDEAIRALTANISACDEVWTVSRGAGENLRKLGYQGEFIVMPNGVDLPKGRVEENKVSETTKDLHLPEKVPVYLFVGRMMWYKGIRITLDALKILDEKKLGFRMVFIGGGADREDIVEYTDALGLGDKVLFIDAISDRNLIRAWYCRADLFLFPSTFDTNGLVVREAAACSLASVLIKNSCAAENVCDGVTGFLIDENAESMAAILEKLHGNFQEMRRIGENACDRLYVSWEDAVSNAVERYGKVTERYKAGEYPAREKFTDDIFHTAANIMDAAAKYRERQEERKESMRQEHLMFQNDILKGEKWIKEEYASLRDDIKNDKAALIEQLSSEKEKVKEKIAEFSALHDRFR